MRFFILFFIFIFSCTTFQGEKTKKIYICGDHPCANKKEARSYFNNNISVEVYTVTSKNSSNEEFDLVKLNMSEKEKIEYVSLNVQEKKIKDKIKKRKKLAKLNIKEINKDKDKVQQVYQKNKVKTTHENKMPPNLTLVRLCKNLEECDIDIISKIVLDAGKGKDFPDITEE